jgi:hypothetical protein
MKVVATLLKKVYFCIAGKKRKYIFASPFETLMALKEGSSLE